MDKRRRLRVLQIGKYYVPHRGGMETHLRTLCDELQKSVDLQVIVANDRAKSETGAFDGVRVTRLGRLLNLSSTPICPAMPLKIRQAGADLVHIHVPNPWAVVSYLASGHRGPMIVSWHSDVVRQRMLGTIFDRISEQFLKRCSAIIASSPNYIESSPTLSKRRQHCVAIPFGIHDREFLQRDLQAQEEIRRRYGPRIVLSTGRLVYYKGLEYLIRAMRFVDAVLLIVGEGPLQHKLEAEVRRNGVAERVRFLGPVEDVAAFYHACDVFVLPSVARSEGFGIVQLEAMACGKPVVNTRLDTGVPFVSLHGVTGLTVEPHDCAEMAHALNQLLGDAQLRKKYGNAAFHRVRTEFTVESMVSKTLRLYAQVTEGVSDALIDHESDRGRERERVVGHAMPGLSIRRFG